MNENLSTYDSYQKADIFWARSIPTHWSQVKIKHLFYERTEKGHPNEPLLSATQSKGVIPTSLYGSRTVVATKGFELLKLVEIGDFVISLRSFQGGIEFAYYRGIISPAYTVMKPNELINSGYFKYLAKSSLFIDLLKACVTGIREGQNINYSLLKKSYIPLPPLDEQVQMHRFLDSKISKINKFIKDKKREIELLKELKQAEVNRLVTKGLNPDAPMKDSGIDWIGEIPEHWKVIPLKHLVTSNVESLSNNTEPDKEISYIDISSVGFGYLKQKPEIYKFKDAPSRARRIVHKGDIIISTVRTYLKSFCFITEDFANNIVSTGFAVLTPFENVNTKYLSYAFSADYFINSVIQNSIGISYPAINDSKLMTLKIVLPQSADEQEVLVQKLELVTKQIDNFIILIEKDISLTQEYTTSLISNVVTGKVDVRDVKVEEVFEPEALEEPEVGDEAGEVEEQL